MTIHTHQALDLDAVCSVWAVRPLFGRGGNRYRTDDILLHPADWDGADMAEEDVAVDIVAGGKGIKGKRDADGTTHSAFAAVVTQYGSAADQAALAPLVAWVDAQDAHGSAAGYFCASLSDETREIISRTSISAVFRAIQREHGGDEMAVIRDMSRILNGLHGAGLARLRAAHEAARAEIVGPGGARVAILRGAREYGTTGALYEQHGVRAVVYLDGCNLGLTRRGGETVRMDHPVIRAVVDAAGEDGEWFAHPAGFLYCRGSRKAPATSPSQVDPRALAEAVVRAMTEET